MFDIFFIVFLFVFSSLCFLEFIVFNEEILLAFCFFAFVFFCFNNLSDSVYDSFNSRALKFEADLLVSYSNKRSSLIDKFFNSLKFRDFSFKFQIMFCSFKAYITQFRFFAANYVISSVISQAFLRLSDLVSAEIKLYDFFQKNCLESLLYPLLFENLKSSLFSLSNSSLISPSKDVTLLKSFSY